MPEIEVHPFSCANEKKVLVPGHFTELVQEEL